MFDAHLNAVVPTFSVRWLMEEKRVPGARGVEPPDLSGVRRSDRPTPDTPATMATTYWMDVTDSEQLRQTLQMTRPVVAILMVDNYEDLMKACPESKRSAVLAQLEEKLDQWSAGADGLMLHYDRDRYLFVFEGAAIPTMPSTASPCWTPCGRWRPAAWRRPCPSAWAGTPTASTPCSKTRPWPWRWL